jgi:hypothetical protein
VGQYEADRQASLRQQRAEWEQGGPQGRQPYWAQEGMPAYSPAGAKQYRKDFFFGGDQDPDIHNAEGELVGWKLNQGMREGGYDPREARAAYDQELRDARTAWLEANEPREFDLAATLAAREAQRNRPMQPGPPQPDLYSQGMPAGRIPQTGMWNPYEEIYAQYRKF